MSSQIGSIGSCFFLLRRCTKSCTKSIQERHGPVGAGPEEGHKTDQRAGTPLLSRKAEGAGVV